MASSVICIQGCDTAYCVKLLYNAIFLLTTVQSVDPFSNNQSKLVFDLKLKWQQGEIEIFNSYLQLLRHSRCLYTMSDVELWQKPDKGYCCHCKMFHFLFNASAKWLFYPRTFDQRVLNIEGFLTSQSKQSSVSMSLAVSLIGMLFMLGVIGLGGGGGDTAWILKTDWQLIKLAKAFHHSPWSLDCHSRVPLSRQPLPWRIDHCVDKLANQIRAGRNEWGWWGWMATQGRTHKAHCDPLPLLPSSLLPVLSFYFFSKHELRCR